MSIQEIRDQIERLKQEVDCVDKTPYAPMLVIRARSATYTMEDMLKENERLKAEHLTYLDKCLEKVGGLLQRQELLEKVVEPADKLESEIQRQLENESGWHQFEFYTPEIDMHWFIKLQKALAALKEQT